MAPKRSYQNLALFFVTILICLAFSEITIRLLCRHDRDGNAYLFKTQLRPYRYPAVSMAEAIQRYLSTFSSFIMYDADLGWSPRPLSKSRDGLYTYNADGIRTATPDVAFTRQPQGGVMRVAIFGDSFTHGDERPFNETWGYYLENDLKKAGVKAEVLNFGVCGYGMDQAYLRWKKNGRTFSPQIVIYAFQPENVQRNLNIIRTIYNPVDEIPFSKPRFIIKGDGLKLLNVPCIDPLKLPGIMADLNSWDLRNYEYWLVPVNYEERAWQRSMVLRVIWNALTREKTRSGLFPEFTRLDREPARLALKIVKAFKSDVEGAGSEFLVAYIPQTTTMAMLLAGKAPIEGKLLKKIDEIATVIHPEEGLKEQIKKTPWRAAQPYHYTGEENGVLARAIADFILKAPK